MPARAAEKVRHLTSEEFAARMRVSLRTVEGWRLRGYGPRYLPARGRGGVLYRESDIEAWEEQQLVKPGAA